MIYKYKELVEKYGKRKTDVLLNTDKYIKISKGLYKDSDSFDDYEEICMRYTNTTLTLQSALYIHHITDYVPDKYYVASLNKGTVIKDDRIIQYYLSNKFYYIGRDKICTSNGYYYVYNIERLLIEVFRFKNKLPYDYFKEICKSYRELVNEGKLDFNRLVEYANEIAYGRSYLKQIQAIIL